MTVGATLRVVREAARVGAADHRAMYTWRTWTFGWLARVLAEVSFYALIGVMLGSREQVGFLLVGNSVLVATTVTMFSLQSTTWERMAGTLPLLVASPTRPAVVFLGRSLVWLPDALASSLAGLVVVGAVFDLDLPVRGLVWVPPILLVCVAATYGLATFAGALALRWVDARNLAGAVVRAVMAVVCGATVSVTFFPAWVGWVSTLFPATYAIRAVRAVVAGGGIGGVVDDVALCGLVGVAWFGVSTLAFTHFTRQARATGSIELGGL
jgi:ABC-2 type transport system permease protein